MGDEHGMSMGIFPYTRQYGMDMGLLPHINASVPNMSVGAPFSYDSVPNTSATAPLALGSYSQPSIASGSYGQLSAGLISQLMPFLTENSMTPLQKRVSEMTGGKQALLGAGLGLLGIGAGALLGRGQDNEYRKAIREMEDTTDEFDMLMDQARRMAPSRADIMGMRGPGISGMQAAEASEAAQARAMRDAYGTYGQVRQQAMTNAQQMRAQLEAMRESRRQQAIQGIGSVIGTAAGMLFPGVGNMAGMAIGSGLSTT